MGSFEYTIVIPAFNESARIVSSLDRILDHVERQHWKAEIIVVNDGSLDGTADIIREYSRNYPSLRLLENPGNCGKGFSVRHGVLEAAGEVILFTDADLSSPIEEASKLFSAIQNGADIAIGSRWLQVELQNQRQPLYRQVFGRIFNLLLHATLGLPYKDTQCGFKAFTRTSAREVFSRQMVDRWGFDPEVLFISRKLGYSIQEVPVVWVHDKRSKINPFTDGLRMFFEMLLIRWSCITGKYEVQPGLTPSKRAA